MKDFSDDDFCDAIIPASNMSELFEAGYKWSLRCGIQKDDANDCASAFLLHMVKRPVQNLRDQQSSPPFAAVSITGARHRDWEQCHDGTPTARWIARCAINFAQNWQRASRRRTFHEQIWSSLTDQDCAAIDAVPDQDAIAPQDTLIRCELYEKLWNCLSAIPPQHSDLLVRHYGDREPLKALAEESGLSEGALQQLFFRLRRKLPKMLAEAESDIRGAKTPAEKISDAA